MPAEYADFDCPECGERVYDNRESKRNPRAPDFKCSNKDCEYVKWPPRNGGSKSRGNQQDGRARSGFTTRKSDAEADSNRSGSAATTPRVAGNDDRSNRIERQHSQEMALRYFALDGSGDMPETKKLRDMISWFQRDIGKSPARTPTQCVEDPDNRDHIPDPEPPSDEPENALLNDDDNEPPF